MGNKYVWVVKRTGKTGDKKRTVTYSYPVATADHRRSAPKLFMRRLVQSPGTACGIAHAP